MGNSAGRLKAKDEAKLARMGEEIESLDEILSNEEWWKDESHKKRMDLLRANGDSEILDEIFG